MKLFWYKPIKYNKKLIIAAIESGANAVHAPANEIKEVKSLAKTKIISASKDADLILGKNVAEVLIDGKEREEEVEKHKGQIPVIIKNKDWTIIPLENLLSKTSNLIQTVSTAEQAKVALQTMERGADGVLLESDDLPEIKKTGEVIQKANNERLQLVKFKIVGTEILGLGDRVCVDTASILAPGQGMLAGDSASAMFLVYNENVKSPYCDPRPFRVNIGAVHAYVRLPEGKTCYAGELKSGMSVIVCDCQGNTQVVYVGRAKIEKRPVLLVKAEYQKLQITLVMQNAETIRLTAPDGSARSITQLTLGDEVLGFVEESCGRHFGVKINESIKEQ
ncbi:MAG: 3-dehydroquinate synthase II [Patescibacteria group bacterium]